ncbi:MAG: TIGR02757 family protein [Syntrophobacteraceae bacterium]
MKSSNSGSNRKLALDAARCPIDGSTLAPALERLYCHYNSFEHIHPDPLEFVYLYGSKTDREITALIASALAYGRVRQILASVGSVLDIMGPSPSAFLQKNSPADLMEAFASFKHRFTTGEMLSSLLAGLAKLLDTYGSLEACFLTGFDRKDPNVLPGLGAFVRKIECACGKKLPAFLPSPEAGSGCKRLNLFLRWMVRSDNVDPGTWQAVPASHLIVPLDTHMHRIAATLGLTDRKQTDIRCAIEITDAFAAIAPDDPVRYDFALTRFGIKPETLQIQRFFSLLKNGVEG